MASFERQSATTLREIAQELKAMRREVEAMRRENKIIRERLTMTGGLTEATTRRAHLVVDGDKRNVYCSACGVVHGDWCDDIDVTLANYGEVCGTCGAVLRGDEEYISGSGNE